MIRRVALFCVALALTSCDSPKKATPACLMRTAEIYKDRDIAEDRAARNYMIACMESRGFSPVVGDMCLNNLGLLRTPVCWAPRR